MFNGYFEQVIRLNKSKIFLQQDQNIQEFRLITIPDQSKNWEKEDVVISNSPLLFASRIGKVGCRPIRR